jgi:hypothetical protein
VLRRGEWIGAKALVTACGAVLCGATALRAEAPRTLVVGLDIDRGEARLVAYTVKDRPFRGSTEPLPEPRPADELGPLQIEVQLLGPAGVVHTERREIAGLCLSHPGDSAPHVAGDTIRLHRDTWVVELPEHAGADRVEVAFHERDPHGVSRRSLGAQHLDRAHFVSAGGPLGYADLRFAAGAAEGGDAAPWAPAAAQVLWPEDFGESESYQIFGQAAEGAQRINVVLVPDGYTHAEKSVMEAHAASMVGASPSRTRSAATATIAACTTAAAAIRTVKPTSSRPSCAPRSMT